MISVRLEGRDRFQEPFVNETEHRCQADTYGTQSEEHPQELHSEKRAGCEDHEKHNKQAWKASRTHFHIGTW